MQESYWRQKAARMYQRCRPVRDEEARKEWARSKRQRCQSCHGKPCFLGLAVHHIVRFGRSDEPCNLLLLCNTCHAKIHDNPLGQRITLGMTLAIKWLEDEDELDIDRLQQLHGRGELLMDDLPVWLIELRKKRP